MSETPRTTLQCINLPLKPSLLLGAVHFPSQMHSSLGDLSYESHYFMKAITQVESQIGHKRTIILGDFNMNPFDPGMIAGSGMNAAMTKNIAHKGSRTINSRLHHFFYNPMWGHFGDRNDGLGGTYYYNKGDCYWNIFDQVLLRPELLEYFSDQDVKILFSDGDTSFLNSNGIPDETRCSDHLPILFRLNI